MKKTLTASIAIWVALPLLFTGGSKKYKQHFRLE